MVQSINNVGKAQQIHGIAFGENGNQYYVVKPQEADSFNGKTLLVGMAAVAGAVIFRKNISKLVQKYMPSVHKWLYDAVNTHVRPYVQNHSDNFIIKNAKKVWNMTGSWGESATNWAKSLKTTSQKATPPKA